MLLLIYNLYNNVFIFSLFNFNVLIIMMLLLFVRHLYYLKFSISRWPVCSVRIVIIVKVKDKIEALFGDHIARA